METSRRNNIVAGLFLIVGLTLAVFLTFLFSDFTERLTPSDRYFVRFPVEQGAPGIKSGSPVLLGGQPIGRVGRISTVFSEDDLRVAQAIEVELLVRGSLVLYDNADIAVSQPLLGSLSSISISHVGGPARANPDAISSAPAPQLVPEDGVIEGSSAPALLAQAGLGPEQIDAIKEILDNANAGVADFRRIAGAFAEDAEPTSGSLRETVEAFRDVSVAIRDRSYEPLVTLQSTLDGADRFVNEQLPGATEQAEGLVTDARDLLNENRDRVTRTLENVESVTARFDGETIDEFESLIQEGRLTLATYNEAGEDIRELITEQSPQLRRTLANVRLVSDQAVLFFDEVRAAPWRLLQRPGNKELGEEILYNAARAYARAVSDLRASSEALDASISAIADGREGAGSPEQIAALRAQLERSFELYAEREQELLDLFAARQ